MSTFKVTDIKSDMMEMEANVSLLIDTLRLFGQRSQNVHAYNSITQAMHYV